jgi:hypothetical protein
LIVCVWDYATYLNDHSTLAHLDRGWIHTTTIAEETSSQCWVRALVDMRGRTFWFVPIEAVQNLKGRFESLEFLGRASMFRLGFLRLSCNTLENVFIETNHDFWAKDTRELFEKAFFDTSPP